MPRAYEIIQQDLLEIEEAGEAVQWTRAALYAEALEWVSPKQVAADVGHSASYIRRLVSTWRAFPTPESREATLSFTHHRLAARTADPAGWIARAVDEQWSTRDLELALQTQRAGDPDEERQRQWAAALQRVRKLLEQADPSQRQTWLAEWDTWRQQYRRAVTGAGGETP